jgi:hypothetical protein
MQRLGQFVLDPCYVAPGESVILAKLDRAVRTVQIEESLTSWPDHVNMGGAVIVEIDNHAQAREFEDCGQIYPTIFPSAWDIKLQDTRRRNGSKRLVYMR